MTKQKKTIAKPARAGPRARKQTAEVAAAPKTKLGQLEGMLRRTEGATIAQIAKALDWQVHSVGSQETVGHNRKTLLESRSGRALS